MDLLTTLPAAPSEPDCIGPIAISRDLAQGLDALTATVAADHLTPYWVCATELVGRWSHDRVRVCARVIRDRRDAVATPAERPTERRTTFSAALRHAASCRPAGAAEPRGRVDVTIVISADGERMYLERTSSATDGPGLELWARSYLQLLSSMVDRPDAPMTLHPCFDSGGDGAPVPSAS